MPGVDIREKEKEFRIREHPVQAEPRALSTAPSGCSRIRDTLCVCVVPCVIVGLLPLVILSVSVSIMGHHIQSCAYKYRCVVVFVLRMLDMHSMRTAE